MTQPVEHLTVKDVAAQLNVSVGKVHQLITTKNNPLPAVNIGKGGKAYWRVSREDFTAWLSESKTNSRFGKAS